jgi:hypothetical protein
MKRPRFTSLIVAGLLLYAPAAGAQGAGPPATNMAVQAPALSVPQPEVMLMLLRTTLVALNQANFTGNYAVLHALSAPRLQAAVSPVELGIAFTELREQRLDMSAVLLLAPELSEPPTITPDGTLRLAGVLRTTPSQIAFVTVFRPIAGIWRLEALSVQARPTHVSAPVEPPSWLAQTVPAEGTIPRRKSQ